MHRRRPSFASVRVVALIALVGLAACGGASTTEPASPLPTEPAHGDSITLELSAAISPQASVPEVRYGDEVPGHDLHGPYTCDALRAPSGARLYTLRPTGLGYSIRFRIDCLGSEPERVTAHVTRISDVYAGASGNRHRILVVGGVLELNDSPCGPGPRDGRFRLNLGDQMLHGAFAGADPDAYRCASPRGSE